MWKIATLLVLAAELTSGYITCPDGRRCPDLSTCCQNKAARGYACCPNVHGVCCADKVHCCPYGSFCNALTQKCDKFSQPWSSTPMLKKVAAEEPSPLGLLPAASLLAAQPQEEHNGPFQSQPPAMVEMSEAVAEQGEAGMKRSTAVPCNSTHSCNDGFSCCNNVYQDWWCCPYSPSTCCLDGNHCCPHGYDCNRQFSACVKHGFRYPFSPKLAASIPAFRISSAEDENEQED